MKPFRQWNLQLFADGDDSGAESNASGAEQQEGAEGEPDPFDAFLKDPKHQAEFDRRVEKAMKTREGNLARQHEEALKAAKSEAEKLAKMNAEQKHQYELEKLQRENESLRAANLRTELGRAVTGVLKDKGIEATQDMLDLIVGSDEEISKANADKLIGIIRAQVKAAEVARATGRTPKDYSADTEQLSEFDKRAAKYT